MRLTNYIGGCLIINIIFLIFSTFVNTYIAKTYKNTTLPIYTSIIISMINVLVFYNLYTASKRIVNNFELEKKIEILENDKSTDNEKNKLNSGKEWYSDFKEEIQETIQNITNLDKFKKL